MVILLISDKHEDFLLIVKTSFHNDIVYPQLKLTYLAPGQKYLVTVLFIEVRLLKIRIPHPKTQDSKNRMGKLKNRYCEFALVDSKIIRIILKLQPKCL